MRKARWADGLAVAAKNNEKESERKVKAAARWKAWYEKNRARRLNSLAAWYARVKDDPDFKARRKAYHEQWRKANPEKWRELCRKANAKRREQERERKRLNGKTWKANGRVRAKGGGGVGPK